MRDEASRTFIRKFSETSATEIAKQLKALAVDAAKALAAEKVAASEMEFGYQVDMRYHGQGLRLTVDVDLKRLEKEGLDAISVPFDAEHTQLFTFALPLEHEFVALRAVAQGKGINIKRQVIAKGGASPAAAAVGQQKSTWTARTASRRSTTARKLKAGNRIAGPAIVMEMDSTTVILPRHHGKVDAYGNILIYPDDYQAPKKAAQRSRRRLPRRPGERRRKPFARPGNRPPAATIPEIRTCPPRSSSATRSR